MRVFVVAISLSVLGVASCQSQQSHDLVKNVSNSASQSISPEITISQTCDDQIYDCDGSQYLIVTVRIVNELDRAVCLPYASLPFDEMPNDDLIELKMEEGARVYSLEPFIHYVRQPNKAELNYIIPPGSFTEGRLNLISTYELKSGQAYSLTYRTPAYFCEMYDSGNWIGVWENDENAALSYHLFMESKAVKFTLR